MELGHRLWKLDEFLPGPKTNIQRPWFVWAETHKETEKVFQPPTFQARNFLVLGELELSEFITALKLSKLIRLENESICAFFLLAKVLPFQGANC